MPILALSVLYGQRHAREVEAARAVCRALDVPHVVIDIAEAMSPHLTGSALTDPSIPVPHGHYAAASMKATVVPNRNMMLLSIATAVAAAHGYSAVAYAAHAGDHAIYPDCREEFIEAMAEAMRLANYQPIDLVAPFSGMSKDDIAWLGEQVAAPMEVTWSCYEGGLLHCGKCGTCVERKEAFELSGVADPTVYEA